MEWGWGWGWGRGRGGDKGEELSDYSRNHETLHGTHLGLVVVPQLQCAGEGGRTGKGKEGGVQKRSHINTLWPTNLSRVAANMYLPLGENLTKETGGLSSSTSVFRHFPVVVSHIRLHKDITCKCTLGQCVCVCVCVCVCACALSTWSGCPRSNGMQSNSPHAIVAAGDNERPIPVEVDCRDGVRVGGKCFQTLTCPNIPHSNALIKLRGEGWGWGGVCRVMAAPLLHILALTDPDTIRLD